MNGEFSIRQETPAIVCKEMDPPRELFRVVPLDGQPAGEASAIAALVMAFWNDPRFIEACRRLRIRIEFPPPAVVVP